MATPLTSAREFCALLAKSKLLPAGEAAALLRAWQADAGGADADVDGFAKVLVKKKIVTPWQAAMVKRGRADGFFLDGYKILDQIGKGQMGGVYKAVHSLGQLVALKILSASRARDGRAHARFQRESRLLTLLDHPNVVRAFQVGESGGRHYIAMEYLDGETLAAVLARRKRLPVAEAVRLVRQTLDGLQHLHDRQAVHRDLKPANLMISPAPARGAADNTWDATAKILDVGLGRELFGAPDGDDQTAAQLTVEGSVVGTPDYMAPEQAKDARTSDIRADIYSVGCVLYHCLTGRPPFPDANIMAQMLRHATDAPDPLAASVADLQAGFQAVVDQLLAKDPAARFPTPDAAARALERFQAAGVGSDPAATSVVPAYRQWLATESGSEFPVVTRPPTAAKPGTAPAAPLPAAKPGTGPTAALPMSRPAAPLAAPPHVVGGAYPYPAPTIPPQSWQSQAAYPAPAPAPAPAPVYPGPAPAYAAPAPVMPPRYDDAVEVELVTLPPAPAPVLVPVADDRPLWELDRRDLILLAAGGGGVLGALGVGYAFARLLRGTRATPADGEAEEK